MKTLEDPVGLRALHLGAGMIDVLHRQVELVLVPLGGAAILGAAVGQHPTQWDALLVEEWNHSVVEKIGRNQRGLAIVELGEGQFGVGVEEGLLIDATDAFECADVEESVGNFVLSHTMTPDRAGGRYGGEQGRGDHG